MKQRVSNPVIEENTVPKRHCMVCGKATEGWYGAHSNTGTCSAACERIQEAKPRFPTSEEVHAMQKS